MLPKDQLHTTLGVDHWCHSRSHRQHPREHNGEQSPGKDLATRRHSWLMHRCRALNCQLSPRVLPRQFRHEGHAGGFPDECRRSRSEQQLRIMDDEPQRNDSWHTVVIDSSDASNARALRGSLQPQWSFWHSSCSQAVHGDPEVRGSHTQVLRIVPMPSTQVSLTLPGARARGGVRHSNSTWGSSEDDRPG